LLAIDFVSLN